MKKILAFFIPYDYSTGKVLLYKLFLELGFFMCLVLFVSTLLLENMCFRSNINPVTVPWMKFLGWCYVFSLLIIVLNVIAGIGIVIISLIKGHRDASIVLFYFLNILISLISLIYFGGTR